MLNCPLCGSPVRAENANPHTRLHCRKCHTPFHLNKAGGAVLGEANDVEHDLEELKQMLRDIRSRIPIKQIVTTMVVVLVVGAPVYYLLKPSQGLAQAAEGVARAIAENDVGYIKSIAAPGTSDEVAQWFDEVHRQLVQRREQWYGRKEVNEVRVASEDRAQGKGVVGVSIHPVFGSARDVTLADPSAATASAASPCDLETAWTQNWWGRWMLDGRDTNARLHPTP
jgi:hypothetical protein